MFDSVLIANRGEIALRVIRACRDLGIRSIAVHSEADREAPHAQAADESHLIGPAPSADSYLRIDRLLEAAARSGANAIHPGYGFLAERATFAQAVIDAGLVFIGPDPHTIDSMGDKTRARRRMHDAGVPIVPGLTEALRDATEAVDKAADIGFPVLLKAAAGGGGKGMRVVEAANDMERAFAAAQRESVAAFGDGSIYLERYLTAPRHVEIQVLADRHGHVVHLGERECSIQRRHQKLVEEAPSPVLTRELRASMGQAAVDAAAAVDYVGAGTVEFLYQDGEYFFLEMNTRLQVEHPVTELVTGHDLVAWQLRVAAGEPLDFSQQDVVLDGHSIECRITSEDPAQGFLPATGTIEFLETPGGPGVRWDGGIQTGQEIGLHYDPLMGKLVTWGRDRTAAIARMVRALAELTIVGLPTSVPFHRRVMCHEAFVSGDLSVRFLEDYPELLDSSHAEGGLQAAVAATLLEHRHSRLATPVRQRNGQGARLSAWRAAGWPWSASG